MSNRRQFIRQTAAFGLTPGLLPGIASTIEVNAASVPNAAEPEVTREVDVLVVGGGTAGTIAAIQFRPGAPARASSWWSETAPSMRTFSAGRSRPSAMRAASRSKALLPMSRFDTDMNGDGLLDVVTGKRFWAHGPTWDKERDAPAVVFWFELHRNTNGEVTFQPKLIDDDSGVGTQAAAVDLNEDRRPDVVVANKKGIFVPLRDDDRRIAARLPRSGLVQWGLCRRS